jgi:hypothetical protein
MARPVDSNPTAQPCQVKLPLDHYNIKTFVGGGYA